MNNVLYIEDNISNIKLVNCILDKIDDVNFIYSQSAKEGLDLVKNTDLKAILLDINIPLMNGYEILKNIKLIDGKSSIPVIALTANALPSDVKHLEQAGFDSYLIKPFDITKLIQIVEGCINLHSIQH